MNPREVLKKALEDPLIDIEYIGPLNHSSMSAIMNGIPEKACISEWKHSVGKVRYEHHIHTNSITDQLRELYANGTTGGNPKITHLYSMGELKEIIRQGQERGYS